MIKKTTLKLIFSILRKSILILCCICFTTNTYAQISYGIKAGLNISSIRSTTDQGIVPDYNNITGFHFGVLADIPINSFLSIQPEVYFSKKGAKYELSLEDLYSSNLKMDLGTSAKPYYIELPIYLKANTELGTVGKLVLGIGPYFAYGISGKLKTTAVLNNQGTSISGSGEMDLFRKDELIIRFNNGESALMNEPEKAVFKRFDVGIAGFIGYEFYQGVFATIGYSYGLYNIENIEVEDIEEKSFNKAFYVSVGYKF